MAKVRPTFNQLRGEAAKLGLQDRFYILDELEKKIIRVIQIQSQSKELKEEEGYTDPYSGERHPGLRDEIERQFIVLNIFDGIQVEDFDVDLVSGKGPDRIDPIELLRLGVPDEIIKKATRIGKDWTALRVQRRKTKPKEHIGGAKF